MEPLDEVEQRVLCPVEILEQHDDRSFRGEPVEERRPRLLEPLARRERMDVGGGVEPERQPEHASSPSRSSTTSGGSVSSRPSSSRSRSPSGW